MGLSSLPDCGWAGFYKPFGMGTHFRFSLWQRILAAAFGLSTVALRRLHRRSAEAAPFRAVPKSNSRKSPIRTESTWAGIPAKVELSDYVLVRCRWRVLRAC